MDMTYIYGLVDPLLPRAIRYIGKSNNPRKRLTRHVYDSKFLSTKLYSWIRGLINEGRRPLLIILEECNLHIWQDRERFWIGRFDEATLFNVSSGGNGCWLLSEETRKKVGDASRGIRRSAESNRKNSEAHKGRRMSQETKEKIRLAMLNRPPMSTESRMKLSASLKGRPKSEEHRRKLSEIRKGKPNPISKETRAKMVASRKGYRHSEETRRKLSEIKKAKQYSNMQTLGI